MAVFQLTEDLAFPDPSAAEPDGLLALGGDLSPQRLLLAYQNGIFPWYSEGRPILWWAPDPRFVLYPDELHVSRSIRRASKRSTLRFTMDHAFADVMKRCSQVPRPGQDGTWITRDMLTAYEALHELGHAHSVEAWRGDELVGGLYGVCIGAAFFGESMFADETDASKIAFARFVETLRQWEFSMVDCQVETEHLARFGARFVPLDEFRAQVRTAAGRVGRPGSWRSELTLPPG